MATFKTRARALDMLGRQQIAGLPTAISELFKNAHDAYADHAEIDYYRSDGLFVLRDDGLGMTEEEFLHRWLTLGTESKLRAKGVVPPPSAPEKKVRPMLGEKGVGRLAIAIIGPQVLVLSRAVRNGEKHDLVAAFIHWGLFECPGLDLDDIEIPVRTFKNGTIPSQQDLKDMVNVVRTNIAKLKERIPEENARTILEDLENFDFDPQEVDSYIPSLSLAGEGKGTHFIIKPASNLLQQDIDSQNLEGATNLIRMLGGFTNTMTPGHEEPVIQVAFRDHKTDDDPGKNLIDPEQFFTPKEFLNADHRICGKFDEYGQFMGTVEVYGKTYQNHIISWKDGRGVPTRCGPFRIEFANVQGMLRETTLPLEDWGALIQKMDAYGGLYIYRDGIRILPYGNTDYDWLDIEKNRSKSAKYYFFSFRRMFGVVTISREENFNLVEKAGREGFRENEAYRQFRAILKNFFVQLAADFFRGDATDTFFAEKKEELRRQDELRKKREASVRAKREKFASELEAFFRAYNTTSPYDAVRDILEEVQSELKALAFERDTHLAAEKFLQIEANTNKQIDSLEGRYCIVRPRGIGLSRQLEKDWEAYGEAFAHLQQSVFAAARRELDELVGKQAQNARVFLDRRIRVKRAIEALAEETKRTTSQEKTSTTVLADDVLQKVVAEAKASAKRISVALAEVASDFARLDISQMADSEVVESRTRLEHRLITIRQKECDLLQSIRGQLEAVDVKGGGLLDQIEAVEQRAVALEEQAGLDLQLTQLGMAIEVINHEFNASILAVRDNLRRLKNWAEVNPSLEALYQNIRNSFDHLDGYLGLFTPLHRRLYRKEIVIRGKDIYTFLSDLFRERFSRHQVQFIATPEFQKMEIIGYPSSFYPVFVNLVDNAVFWTKDGAERTITLDALNGKVLVVRDTGPGILVRDRESVFELGFSRKPGGRGMGLYISREVLRKIDYDLELYPSEIGAEFHIFPHQDKEEVV
ncbi:ATP-binding protein [Mailhella sp.]